MLVVPAMGVEQKDYAAFAHWMAARGYFVATFDYRGIGHSRLPQYRRSLRGFQAEVTTWARCDCAAMVDYVAGRAAGNPLLWLGHGLGGHLLALVPNHRQVATMLTVSVRMEVSLSRVTPLRVPRM